MWLNYKQIKVVLLSLSLSLFFLERWGSSGDQKARRIADASSTPGAAGDVSPKVSFQGRLSYGAPIPP